MGNTSPPTFDYIIVGAGSAGSVIANKLSEDGLHSVLLLERGMKDSSPLLTMPKGFGAVLTGDKYVSRHIATRKGDNNEPSEEVWLRGKTLGGSSSVNGMLWIRPQPEGFARLSMAGGDKWNWSHVEPYFNALDGAGAGGGIIPTSMHKTQHEITNAFIESARKTGLPYYRKMPDVGRRGVGYLHYNIDHNGKRFSASTAFLKPLRRRANVSIETETQVEKILFNGKRATAVTCYCNTGRVTYFATKEILLCAGALESPQILQRSGVGPAETLAELGIPIVYENAQVGANLREHLLLGISFEVKSWTDSENRQYSGFPLIRNILRYLFTKKGPMAEAPCHAAAFGGGDDPQSKPSIQFMLSPFSRNGNNFSEQPGISIAGYPMYPKSVGEIRISSPHIGKAPLIDPNYLSDEHDRQLGIEAVRYIRRIAALQPLASRLAREASASASAQSDAEILDLYRKNGQPGYHATGTCAMGSDAASSVVDGNTRVHGIEGVRVVDCSIFPEMPAGATNASVLGLALRAADLILDRDLL